MNSCTSLSTLRKLVSFDTTSRNSNLALIEWAADYLRSRGARVELIYNCERSKANLLASLGPNREGGVVLSGHTDVVPVDGQDWSSDPFNLQERDGRLYGRGSSDMKAFIACSLAAADRWQRQILRRPFHFAFSYDEEVGCIGAHSLVERIVETVPRPAFAIVGEPTEMRIGMGHNGVIGSHTRFRGVAAHASDPSLGMNAIDAAVAFIAFLGEIAKLPQIAGHGCTVNVGRISGGTATNIVAEHCGVHWEYRASTQEDIAAIGNMVARYVASKRLPNLEISTEVQLDVPAFFSNMDEPTTQMLHRFGALLPATRIPFGSEAGIFARHMPTVVCGPGSINQAHRVDEWIARTELDAADDFLTRLGAWASQSEYD